MTPKHLTHPLGNSGIIRIHQRHWKRTEVSRQMAEESLKGSRSRNVSWTFEYEVLRDILIEI